MGKILYHMLHDPVGNCEAVLQEYDPELIGKAAESGMIFIAVDDEGGRTVVAADEVAEPNNDGEPFTLVRPAYVDERMKAVVDVFDALASSAPAAASTLAVQSAAGAARSSMTFAEALEALRLLAYGADEEGGE